MSNKAATTAPNQKENSKSLEELSETWDPSTFTDSHLEQIIKDLVLNKPFFGYTLYRIDRKLDNTLPAPAALDIKTLNILVNPILFSQFTVKEQIAIMEHEVLHYAFKHPARFKAFYEKVMKNRDFALSKRLNIAMDAAINQLIDNIPEGCVTLDTIREIVDYIYKEKPEAYDGVKPDVLEKQTSEYYFHLINHTLPNEQEGGEGQQGESGPEDMDQHKHLFSDGQGNSFNEKEMENIINNAKQRQKAEDRINGVGAGNSIIDLLPEDTVQVHDKIWRKLVEKSFGEILMHQKDVCYGRPSRRREGSNWYGKRQMKFNTVYVGLDTSASVSDNELGEFLGYIDRGMKKYETEVVLIQCDWEVEHVKRLKRISKRDLGTKIHGRGGTDMTKILDWIEENDKDPANARLILLTDGYTPWRDSKVNTNVVYTEHHSLIDNVENYAVIHESGVFDA